MALAKKWAAKYHNGDCGELKSAEKRTKKEIIEKEVPEADAIAKGYKECEKCKK